MANRKAHSCTYCGAQLTRDETALSRKMLGRKVERLMCISCLADYLSCSEDYLRAKIKEFREQGCALFL